MLVSFRLGASPISLLALSFFSLSRALAHFSDKHMIINNQLTQHFTLSLHTSEMMNLMTQA